MILMIDTMGGLVFEMELWVCLPWCQSGGDVRASVLLYPGFSGCYTGWVGVNWICMYVLYLLLWRYTFLLVCRFFFSIFSNNDPIDWLVDTLLLLVRTLFHA